MRSHRAGWIGIVLMLVGISTPAWGQMLHGSWVDESQERIDKVRKTDVRVIVADGAGGFVSGAKVQIHQLGHDFNLGLAISHRGWPNEPHLYPVWRCLNSLSLSRVSSWAQFEPAPGQGPLDDHLSGALAQAGDQGLMVRWGSLISADVGRNADWVGQLRGEALAGALAGYVDRVLSQFGDHVEEFDVYSHSLDHAFVETRLGVAMVRRLFEQAKAAAPQSRISVRFEDCLTGPRQLKMQQRLTQWRQEFIRFDQIAVAQRIGGTLSPAALARQLAWLDDVPYDVVICNLEVGGPSATAAAINMETLLRLLWSHKRVKGIWFGGLYVDEMIDPNAALLENNGQPTPVGRAIDNLFGKQWWSQLDLTTDELGNAYGRVFAGRYRITATLGDGRQLETTVWLAVESEERVILLQPLQEDPGR